jgi:hypothetical protein
VKRSPSFDVDRDFDVFCDVTKYTTLPDGRRLIRGVATGTIEDRDGERVSARAIAEMIAQGPTGVKVVAGPTSRTGPTRSARSVELRHDAETDELIADAILPPAGKDPLADKAIEAHESGERLGWSIGGKLRSAYFELAEDARRRCPQAQGARQHQAAAPLPDREARLHAIGRAVRRQDGRTSSPTTRSSGLTSTRPTSSPTRRRSPRPPSSRRRTTSPPSEAPQAPPDPARAGRGRRGTPGRPGRRATGRDRRHQPAARATPKPRRACR